MSETMLFDADVMALTESTPARSDLYLVLAVWNQRWAIPSCTDRGGYGTYKAAEEAASHLPDGWHWPRIVRIPGEGGA